MQLIEDPACGVDSLRPAERDRVLVEWNDTRVDYPRDACIHALFAAQARRAPESIALDYEGGQLSYGELNDRADRLARSLQRLGVGPDVLVAVCMDRCPELIVALLGILKAGGAYVPLDPAYPRERLAFMLEDTQAPVLLTQECHAPRLPAYAGHVLCLDSVWESIDAAEDAAIESGATGESLAYVMYTSGSTGRPKAAVIPHRAVLRLLLGVDYVRLDATETVLHMAPISFDASTFEVWGPLLHGGRCVLFKDAIPSPREIGKAIREHGVTTMWLTAALFNTLIDESPGALAGLRQLLIGGEALSVSHVRRALELLPSTQIINGYGPTESTTFACCCPIPRSLPADLPSIPIGRPIANTRVYILGERMEPLPAGVPGELYIGGDGLARGYLNRPELTQEKFVPDPFCETGRGRLYKTGDRARYLPDGTVEFLGRLDHQVKIRGFRIELGEIEAVLCRHPGIRRAVARVREPQPGNKRLIAYYAAEGEHCPTPADLRDYLKERLPEYMIPAVFVAIRHWPLTPNGKLDREALPEPEDRGAAEAPPIAPQTATERIILQIWREVIGRERLGLYDNFFDLGGTSLNMAQVHTRLCDRLNADVPITRLFQYPTISALARHLTREHEDERPLQNVQDRAQRSREALARQRQLPRGRTR